MAKNIKNLGRRGLAIFLSLVMMTSLLQISAFAYKNQVMDGNFTVDAEGNIGTTDATSVTEDGYTLTKSIRQTGKDAFEITLTVETSQTVVTSDAAVQLVIDTSTSMSECSENCGSKRCSHDTRLEAIQKILTQENGFLDRLAAANTGKVLVSVVKFNYGANTEIEWTDIKTANGLAAVKRAVNDLSQQTGTNIYGGLMLARNRWGMDAVKNASAKYTVLLSDGEAHHSSNASTSTSSIAGTGTSSRATSLAASMAAEVNKLSSVYAVGYGVQKSYLESIVGEGSHVLVGADSSTVSAAFANIAQSAVSGMSGAGTSVSDPMGQSNTMGQYIVLGGVVGQAGVSAVGNAIRWELDPANAKTEVNGNTTKYTYSITYPVTLDTSVRGFEEVDENGDTKYYPTNGYTYLNVPQADGSVKQIAFLVPGVCGEIPEVEWKIEYYLQDEAAAGDYDSYKLDNTVDKGEVKVWTTVDAPEGYEKEYEKQYYKFVAGNVKLEITPSGENVMRLYYDHKTSEVTVNHFYKTDRITAEGVEEAGAYPETPDKTSQETVRVMSDYTAVLEPEFNQAMYELDYADPQGYTARIQEDAEKNIINIYYTRLVDERAITSAEVKHVYTTYGYELVDGKYELVETGSQTETAEQAAEIRATTVFDVSDQPLKGYEDFDLNTEKGDYEDLLQESGKLSFVVAESAAANVRTLHFEKVVDEREAIEVTVNHYYTKTVTSIEDGKVVVTTDPNGELGSTTTVPAYVGEKFEAAEINDYEGDVYVSDAGNAGKLVVEALEGDKVIDLYYSLTVIPEKTEIVVNHIYRTVTEVTVELTRETTDEEGNPVVEVIGTTTEERIEEDHRIDGTPVSLYVGESYTAPKQAWGEGYVYNESDSNDTGIGGTDFELNLYYDNYADADERAVAEIDVQHNYVTKLTTIVDGKVDTITVPDGSVTESFPAEGEDLRAGDEFTAVAAPEYKENTYTQLTEESALGPVVLQPGTNATIVIDYEREASDLVDTAYEVNYEYRTYTMAIGEDGVAAYGEPAVEYGETVSGTGYVGQKITLEDGKREGFTAFSAPATEQILASEGNSWTFVYEKYIPLEKGSVVVNHYYSLQTIAIDGTSSWSSSVVSGTAVEKYLGESYVTEPVLNGYDKMDAILDGASFAEPYALTVSGDHVVDFHYKKVVDNSVRAPYSITHKYFLYDWDGSLISESASEPQTGVGYVTNTITAAPEVTDYTLVSATYNGEDLGEMTGTAYTITLQQGSNDVVFTYEKRLSRDKVDVTVIHNYYQDEAALTEGAEPLASYTDTATGVEEETSFTAEIRNQDGYAYHSADPESRTIVVKDDGENIVIINYVRASAQYEVIHIYNLNGSEEDRTAEIVGGLHGDEVKGADIARVNTNDGKTYSFVSVSEDIVLDSNEMKTITLTYNRTLGRPPVIPTPDPDPTPNPDPKPNPDPEQPVIEIPEEDVPLAEIPEEEVPMAELPDEEVPLADVPKTGDISAVWSVMAAVSGLGLAGLGLTGKKRREDEEV